jgi:hypothetical protein
VLDVFHSLGRPTYHMLGNHCLYNLPRPRLNERCVETAAVNSQTQHPPARWLLPTTMQLLHPLALCQEVPGSHPSASVQQRLHLQQTHGDGVCQTEQSTLTHVMPKCDLLFITSPPCIRALHIQFSNHG